MLILLALFATCLLEKSDKWGPNGTIQVKADGTKPDRAQDRESRNGEIYMTPRGELRMATSNCDGRGECGPDKDMILRVVLQ